MIVNQYRLQLAGLKETKRDVLVRLLEGQRGEEGFVWHSTILHR